MSQSSGGTASRPPPFQGAERAAVVVAFVVYLVFQFHASALHGYWGQDWIDHKNWIAFAAKHPGIFFTQYAEGRTNPPLFHLLGAAVREVVGLRHYLIFLGVVNVGLGFAGACFAYGAIRRLIASPLLRVACLLFVLFLPFAMIHAQVIASDALATPLFFLLLWLLLRLEPSNSIGRLVASLCVIAPVIVLGVLTKFTFASTIPAVGAWALLWWRTGVLSGRRLIMLLLGVVLFPGLLAYRESVKFRAGQSNTWGLHWPARLSEAEMNPRSLVGLRAADRDVLSAPAYNWKVNGEYALLSNNRHSYPALLHLGMFTDIMNIYQFDPYDHYFGRRTDRNHSRMQLAVRIAIVASALAITGVITLLFVSIVGVCVRRQSRNLAVLLVLLLSLAWFANIVVPLPLVAAPYMAGFWLPRLVAPALLGFFIVAFVFLDRLQWRSNVPRVAVLVGVLVQSALHASFLWPHHSDDPLHEPDRDVANSTAPVLRVFSWQDSRLRNHTGTYWLDRRIGIVMNRPAGAGGAENWSVGFTVAPGPASQATRGVLRVSSPRFGTKLIDFEGTTKVQLDVSVVAGRNDVVVELVSPAAVEPAHDTNIRILQVSGIEVRPPRATEPLPISP